MSERHDTVAGSNDEYVRAVGAVWRRCFDDVLVLAPGADEGISVTSPGWFLWERLAAPVTIDALANELTVGFGISLETALDDVALVVGRLRAAGAVVVVRSEDRSASAPEV